MLSSLLAWYTHHPWTTMVLGGPIAAATAPRAIEAFQLPAPTWVTFIYALAALFSSIGVVMGAYAQILKHRKRKW